MNATRSAVRFLSFCWLCCGSGGWTVSASDHADPIDPLNRLRQEGAITDLFVFPVRSDESPAHPWLGNSTIPLNAPLTEQVRPPMTPEQVSDIDSLVVILCVRRALTDSSSLKLEPYTYRVHIDTNPNVVFEQDDGAAMRPVAGGSPAGGYGHSHASGGTPRPTPHEAFLRYGGLIQEPESITEEVVMEFRLTGQGKFAAGYPRYVNRAGVELSGWSGGGIQEQAGVFEDPFIFPAFFRTNVVAMAVRIPINVFRDRPRDFLVWATSHQGKRQIDHQGRSLRTQNPRFELLNTLHPSQHVQAIQIEHEQPGLLRDIALRLNFAQTFAYRRWDFTPDVLIYTTRYPVGFPNGRLLTDDVAALLAQWGDTLLFELSHQHDNATWPRQNRNDSNEGRFEAKFPYLLPPFPEREQAPPPGLTAASVMKLWGIAALLFAGLVLENAVVAWLWCRWKERRRRVSRWT
jgi:hypothetical protein